MSNIPGLSICPVEDASGEGIDIPSFTHTINVPEAHRYGNCRTIKDFERLSKISEGTFGILYKCKDLKSGDIYTLKKFKMHPDFHGGIPSAVLREMSILNALKHINIVNSHGTVAGKNLDSNYLVLDHCAFSLHDLIEMKVHIIRERHVVKYIMNHIFQALEYIHAGLIIHRNICPQNIMFTDAGVLKITGFSSSRFYTTGNMTPNVTDLAYRAPELLFQTKVYGPAVDMWSSGCVLATLLLRKPLFAGSSELEVLKSIFEILGIPSEDIWPGFQELISQLDEGNRYISGENPYSFLKRTFTGVSSGCKDIIQDLIIYYPNARLSAQDCLKCTYFTESPTACSTQFMAAIFQNISRIAMKDE